MNTTTRNDRQQMFPPTRRSLIDVLSDPESTQWQSSWSEFFDLYHQAVRVCLRGALRKRGWERVSEADLQDLVMSVFESIFKRREVFNLDPSKGRFRQLLTTVCNRRAVDYIRKQGGDHAAAPSGEEAEAESAFESEAACDAWRAQEEQAFGHALLDLLLSELRRAVSPLAYMALDRVKLCGESPDLVAADLGVRRGVVDNSVYKAMQKLRAIARHPMFQEEMGGSPRGGISSLIEAITDPKFDELRQASQASLAFRTSEQHIRTKTRLDTRLRSLTRDTGTEGTGARSR